MAKPHIIRLRGPWEYKAVELGIAAGRVTLPAPGLPQISRGGAVELSRRFGMPTGLGVHDRVWLVIQALGSGIAILNDGELGPLSSDGRLEVDVTTNLAERNELRLELKLPSAHCVSAQAGESMTQREPDQSRLSFLEVWLEIRSQ